MQDNIFKYLFDVSITFYHFDDHGYLSNFLSVCHQRVSCQQTVISIRLHFGRVSMKSTIRDDVRAANCRRRTIRGQPKGPYYFVTTTTCSQTLNNTAALKNSKVANIDKGFCFNMFKLSQLLGGTGSIIHRSSKLNCKRYSQ
jgi:hypothetical protein